jgi:hypothetical protein
MPDQAAVPVIAASPSAITPGPGPASDTDVGARVIPLDTRRRRPSPEAIAASRAVHPAQLWAEAAASATRPSLASPA